jgi:hypothetical protein
VLFVSFNSAVAGGFAQASAAGVMKMGLLDMVNMKDFL